VTAVAFLDVVCMKTNKKERKLSSEKLLKLLLLGYSYE